MSENRFPVSIQGKYANHRANTDIHISRERIRISIDGQDFEADGDLILRILPSPSLVIRATFSNVPDMPSDVSELRIDLLGRAVSTQIILASQNYETPDASLEISGLVKEQHLEIKRGEHLSGVVFHLMNFHDFFGPERVLLSPDDRFPNGNRVKFSADGWSITIDSTASTESNLKELSKIGGFAITHVGTMERDDRKPFTIEEAQRMIEGLRYFLSFNRGLWVSPVLLVGYDADGKEVWEEFGVRRVSAWKYVRSCFDPHHTGMLAALFLGFNNRMKDPLWSEDMLHAVYWYLESNAHVGGTDGSLMLGQVGLELLSWNYLVEDKENLTPNGFNKLDASDQFRLLISLCGIPLDVPAALTHLDRFAKAENFDGPGAITDIRNKIVHPGKRSKKPRPATMEIYEARELALWYIELVLLHLFQYRDIYASRVSGARWAGEVGRVPWAQ
jgi:hypothetical protein